MILCINNKIRIHWTYSVHFIILKDTLEKKPTNENIKITLNKMYLSFSTLTILNKTSGYFFHLWIEKQDITAFKGTNASWGSYITEFVGQYCEGVNDKDRRRAAGARDRKKRKFWRDGELRQEKWGWWKKGDIWGKVQNSRQQREEEKEGSGGDFCFLFSLYG